MFTEATVIVLLCVSVAFLYDTLSPMAHEYITTSVLFGFICGLVLSGIPLGIVVGMIIVTRRVKDRKAFMSFGDISPHYIKAFEQTLKAINMQLLKEQSSPSSIIGDLYCHIDMKSPLVDSTIANIESQKPILLDWTNMDLSTLISLLLSIVSYMPYPIMYNSNKWKDISDVVNNDRERAITLARYKISSLPSTNRHLLLLILRHIHTLENNFKVSLEDMIPPWSDSIWPEGFSSNKEDGLKVLTSLIHLQPELLAAFSLSHKEREYFHKYLTNESRSQLASLLIEHESVMKQIIDSEESAHFLTMMGSRWFMEYNDDVDMIEKLQRKLNGMLTDNGLPSFIESVTAHSVTLGTHFPHLSKVRVYPTRPGSGEFAYSIMAEAKDGPGAVIDILFVFPLTKHKILISLSLRLSVFKGRVWCYLPSPHEDKGYGWVSVEQIPDIAFKIDLHVGYIPQKYVTMITSFVEGKLTSGFIKELVLPSWKRIEMPWSKKSSSMEIIWCEERDLVRSPSLLQPSPYKTSSGALGSSEVDSKPRKEKDNNVNNDRKISELWKSIHDRKGSGAKEVELQDMKKSLFKSKTLSPAASMLSTSPAID